MEEKKQEIMVKVRKLNLGSTPESYLVEWVEGGEARRGFIPAKKLTTEGVSESVLKHATPFGIPWAKIATFSATGEGLEKALHNADIWTLDDLVTKIQAAIGALQTAYYIDYAALKSAAKQFKTEVTK